MNDGKRLFPIRFRHLEGNKFRRWDWVKFGYKLPTGDTRKESCHVFEDKLKVDGQLSAKERAAFLNQVVLGSAKEASENGLSLTLVRPRRSHFRYRRKSASDIEAERMGYKQAASQTSWLDRELESLEPIPYEFEFTFGDTAGTHKMQCGDWETSATYWKFSQSRGEQAALAHLDKVYNRDYPQKGMVFALGTMKKRPKQWLLLGVIRLNETPQSSFDFVA